MPTHEFTARTRQRLEGAGWTDDRTVDTSTECQSIEAEGYFVSEAAQRFLSRFGGLIVRLDVLPENDPAYGCSFDFVASDAARGVYVTWAKRHWIPRIGAQATPVGQRYCDHFTLLIDERGRFFMAFERLLFHLADSPNEALEILCEGRVLIGDEILPIENEERDPEEWLDLEDSD